MLTLFLIISLHHLLHLKTLDFDVFNPSFINLEVPVWCILIWHGQRAQNRFPQGSGNSHGRPESPWTSIHRVHLCGKKPPVPCWNIQQALLVGSDHKSKELRIFWVSLIFGNEKLLSSILERDQRSIRILQNHSNSFGWSGNAEKQPAAFPGHHPVSYLASKSLMNHIQFFRTDILLKAFAIAWRSSSFTEPWIQVF